MSDPLLSIELADGKTTFLPGEKITGRAQWSVARARSVEIRLFWYTVGPGVRDVGIVARKKIESPESQGQSNFEFRLPDSPYSFQGQLITLKWAVELVIQPRSRAVHADLVMGPSGREIVLGAAMG